MKDQDKVSHFQDLLRSDKVYYQAFKDNIAMAFQDAQHQLVSKHGRNVAIDNVWEISNTGGR